MQDAKSAIGFLKEVFPHRLWAWNKCIRRSIIGDLRFGDFQPCEDAVFISACLFRSRTVLVLPDVLYKYVQHEESCMRKITAKHVDGDIKGLSGLCDAVLAWRHGDRARRFVRRQLEQRFLAIIPSKIRRLHLDDDRFKQKLTDEFFDAADHVFVNSRLCDWLERKVYGAVLSWRSLDVLDSFLKWKGRVGRILSLPQRASRKMVKMLSVRMAAKNGS